MKQTYRNRSKRVEKPLYRTWIIFMVAFLILCLCAICFIMHQKQTDVKLADTESEPEKMQESTPSAVKLSTPLPEQQTEAPPAQTELHWLRKNLDKEKPMVALTFDDGPYTPVTSTILDTLKKYNAKATFFVVGNRVPTYSSIMKRAYDEGNEIASHTYSHAYLNRLEKKQLQKEYNRANKKISDVIGSNPNALRPPGGFVDKKTKKTIPVPLILWSVDTEDWKSRNAQSILKRCRTIRDGDIILMHDLYSSTSQAIKKLVPRLTRKGFQLVTIEELFYYKNVNPKSGNVYTCAR